MKYSFLIFCSLLLVCIISYEVVSAFANSDFSQLYTVQFIGLSCSLIAFIWNLVDLYNAREKS